MRPIAILFLLLPGCASVVVENPHPPLDAGAADVSVTCTTDCNDDNPCTLDACIDGTCVHDSKSTEFIACDDWFLMQCQGGTCTATVEPPDCLSDQDCVNKLGAASFCMAHVCWFSCETPYEHACDGMPVSDSCRTLHEGKDVHTVCVPPAQAHQ